MMKNVKMDKTKNEIEIVKSNMREKYRKLTDSLGRLKSPVGLRYGATISSTLLAVCYIWELIVDIRNTSSTLAIVTVSCLIVAFASMAFALSFKWPKVIVAFAGFLLLGLILWLVLRIFGSVENGSNFIAEFSNPARICSYIVHLMLVFAGGMYLGVFEELNKATSELQGEFGENLKKAEAVVKKAAPMQTVQSAYEGTRDRLQTPIKTVKSATEKLQEGFKHSTEKIRGVGKQFESGVMSIGSEPMNSEKSAGKRTIEVGQEVGDKTAEFGKAVTSQEIADKTWVAAEGVADKNMEIEKAAEQKVKKLGQAAYDQPKNLSDKNIKEGKELEKTGSGAVIRADPGSLKRDPSSGVRKMASSGFVPGQLKSQTGDPNEIKDSEKLATKNTENMVERVELEIRAAEKNLMTAKNLAKDPEKNKESIKKAVKMAQEELVLAERDLGIAKEKAKEEGKEAAYNRKIQSLEGAIKENKGKGAL